MDNPTAESRRTLRSKLNSVSSDINELPGSDVGTPRKTRSNTYNDGSKINTRRSKCFTRAGSEAKSPPTTRVRRTRASSIEPEAMTSSKLDKYQSELISTPIITRRRASMLPSEATVLEEKECKKIAIVTLDRTLSNVTEIKETEAETHNKTPQKNESLSTSKNKLDASQKSIDEKHLEDNVQEPYNNSPENLSSNSSNNVEDVEKNVSVDKKISDNDKNAVESSETSEAELLTDNDSKKKDTSIEMNLKLDDSNDLIGKHDSHSNKETLTTNTCVDMQDTKNTTSSTQQTSKSLSVSDEKTSKYSSIETNISPKRRHSEQLLEVSNENVSIKKVNDTSDTVNLSVINLNVSTNEGNKSDNIQKLVVNTKTELIIGSPSSEKLDKTPIQVTISSSSNDSIEIVEHAKDVTTIDDDKPDRPIDKPIEIPVDKPIEIGTELNETSEKMCINESKENVDIKMNTSSVKEDMNENKSEENNTSQCVTSGQCDTKKKNDNLNISKNVYEKDEISCTELITFPKSSNIDSPNSADVKLISDIQCSIVSKHKNIHSEKNEMDNLPSNSNNLLKSSDTHTNLKDSVLNNINETNVSNVIKSSDSSIVTETPAELVEEMSKRGEHSKNVSVVDDFTDSLTLKKECENKLELSEEHSDVNQMSKECQENMKIDDSDSDTNVTNVFQDILASEWEGKDNDTNEKPIHLNSTENESEGECDLILVDREAWLAAENLKNKETNTFDYDSDDTVVSKALTDFIKARKNEGKFMDTLKEEYNLNDNQDKSSSAKKRKIVKENKNRNEEGSTMEDAENITQDVEMSINVDKNVSLTKNSNKHSTSKNNKSIQKSSEDESLFESYKVGEKNLSLNEHKLSEDIPKKRKSLNKSIQKEETNKLEKFNKETVEKRNSLNKSNRENVVASAKKDEKNQLLNTLKKKIKPQQLNEEITEESDNKLKKAEFRKKQDESDESRNISDSDDSRNKSLKIPTFLFRGVSDSSDDDNESNNTIDSDIKMEYNFDGLELPDDDVPGDECRASETESSDSNDNGSDLADFVVDDDEDEEEIESEEKEVKIESDLDDTQDVKEDEKEIEEIIEKKEHENDNKNIDEKDKSKLMDTSNVEKNTSRKSNYLNISQTIGSDKKKKKLKIDTSQTKDGSKLMDTSNIEKNKSRKSNDLNISQTIGSDKKKKKKVKIDTSQTENDDEEDSYTNLSFETEKIKQKQDFEELVSENIEKQNIEKDTLLNESQLFKVEKLRKSIECSTPKINISKQEICDIKKQDSFDKKRNKNLTLKEKQYLKKLDDIKVNESLIHRSLPSELIELTTETNLSRPMSSKILELNKETLVLKNKTSTTKCLKNEKLNESAPTLKLDAKSKEVQLTIAGNSSIQNDQSKTENENKDKQKMKTTSRTADVNDSLKRKLLKVAGNILESDRHKKHKKRKQLTFEEAPDVILSTNDFKKDNDSLLTKTTQQFVPITNIDNNNEIEKENKKKKKKKKERDNIDAQIREKINEEIETKPEGRNTKIHDEVKKKKKKEKEVESVSDFTNEKSKIIKKEKKISSSLSNENISNEQPSKKKHKKQKLLIKDDALQHRKVSVKKVPEEKQKISSDILNQNKNTLVKKLSEKERKQLLENIKSIVVPHKKQQLKDAISDSDEGPETITFSKARDDVMGALKRTADSIKANKEMKKKKQKEHTEKMQKQKEIKINELESKNQITESSKMKKYGKGVKRLADNVLENLSDVPLKSIKKRKVSEESSTFSSKPIIKVKNIIVEDDFLTLPSGSGSTTQFSVIDIQTIKKSKKIPKISSFRENMFARNSRQPVSAYLMYLKKQETLGKRKFYDKPY
ncbi:hypothetical protein K0M31_005672 [Melipona bicolor]|uniref:Uncharacterized protein n=1 Tax=Melipona bicolor TaxID=60889 RepID=A0AA40FUU8_9HYME|nr:hypothetical protein K0M31_005672 [Melipona bicolor]